MVGKPYSAGLGPGVYRIIKYISYLSFSLARQVSEFPQGAWELARRSGTKQGHVGAVLLFLESQSEVQQNTASHITLLGRRALLGRKRDRRNPGSGDQGLT